MHGRSCWEAHHELGDFAISVNAFRMCNGCEVLLEQILWCHTQTQSVAIVLHLNMVLQQAGGTQVPLAGLESDVACAVGLEFQVVDI